MPRLRPATHQTPNAEEQKKSAAIAAAAEAKRLAAEAEGKTDDEEEVLDTSGEADTEQTDDHNDAMDALKKQIEELKKSEEIQRNLALKANQDREEAIRRSKEREAEVRNSAKEVSQAKLDAITSGIATAKAEAAQATYDLEAATQIGDIKAQAEAYRKLARAETNLARLEDGKVVAEEAIKAEAAPAVERRSDDPIENMNAPDSVKTWLRAHPEYVTDIRKNTKVQALHWDILDEGHAFGSPGYLESMEIHLGLKKKPATAGKREEEEEDDASERDSSIVSAPVSREVPSGGGSRGGGTIRLSAKQREAAKLAGISDTEYAKQLQKLTAMRADGSYDGDR